jgi:hypothetical protein
MFGNAPGGDDRFTGVMGSDLSTSTFYGDAYSMSDDTSGGADRMTGRGFFSTGYLAMPEACASTLAAVTTSWGRVSGAKTSSTVMHM